MAGFFEFSLMRIRNDIDQKVLSELFFQYMNVEEDFIKDLFCEGRRVSEEHSSTNQRYRKHSHFMYSIMNVRREVINKATHRAVGVCYCRHKMSHVGKACVAPLDICMTFIALPNRSSDTRLGGVWMFRSVWTCFIRRTIVTLYR